MEKAAASEKERDDTTVAVDETAVATPERANSSNGDGKDDVEKGIADQRDGLPAPIEIPDGGWKAWLTVLGA